MDPYCECGSTHCVCIGKCCCCPRVCRCEICVEDRNTRMCENCKKRYSIDYRTIESPEEAAPNSGLAAAAAAPKSVFTMYPGVRFDNLPDLDFLNPRQSSGATGYSSSSITVSKKNDRPQARCLSSSDSSPEDIFQMDDIHASLTSIAPSSVPRSYSSPGSLQRGIRLGDELSNETSRQLKVPPHAKSTKYSPSKSPKSREPSPPCVFSVSKSPPTSVSPKKSPNCLSKSETQLPDCPPDSDSQSSAKQISPEIKTQSQCINDNDLHSNSADKPSDDEVEPDQQESSK